MRGHIFMFTELEKTITDGWEIRDQLNATTTGDIPEAVRRTLAHLDAGEVRIAENIEGHWKVHEWAKKAVLLSFRLRDCFLITDPHNPSYDKIGLKFEKWTFDQFKEAGFRVVPGATVRHSAYIAPGVVLMPSFVNVGAYVGQGTMVDTGARIGSCAQVGKNCHISGGVGLGGVLEPLQANPVIIEDNCFIGANSEIAEGVIVETGAVIGMGVMLGASTKIVDRETGEITFGRVPAYAVVVPGSLPGKPLADGTPGPNLNCAVIIKRVDEKTRSKTAINELLR